MRVPLIVAATLSLALTGTSGAGVTRVTGAPPGLTIAGRNLWNLEALLRQTFGSNYQGCLKSLSQYVETFTKDSWCATHGDADFMGYTFAFARPSGSSFHLVDRSFPLGAFGNYPQPIRVETDYVACDPAGRTFLISYGDVIGLSANLACIKPNP